MQTVLLVFLWFQSFGGGGLTHDHPFHVSVTEINQNTTDQTLEVQTKFFIDDFEATLKSVYGQKADLADPALLLTMDSLVSRYMKSRLQIRVNDKPVELRYIGFEPENEAVFVYMEIANVTSVVKSLDISSKFLFEQFTDQINVFHATMKQGRSSSKLTYPAQSLRLVW